MLLAMYEHEVFTMGAVWGVNSFDQWGVELGKQLAKQIAADLSAGQDTSAHDGLDESAREPRETAGRMRSRLPRVLSVAGLAAIVAVSQDVASLSAERQSALPAPFESYLRAHVELTADKQQQLLAGLPVTHPRDGPGQRGGNLSEPSGWTPPMARLPCRGEGHRVVREAAATFWSRSGSATRLGSRTSTSSRSQPTTSQT